MIRPIKTLTSIQLGDYQPLVRIASGGMATLYVARKVGAGGFERLVAIKRVHAHLLENADFRAMFRDEARVCSVIRHPNVVSLVDVVDAEGELFLVLDYVESLSFGELLRASSDAGKRLPPAVVSRIMTDALAGLHAAHEAVDLRGMRLDVIHRDVSPHNVIVGVDGASRLIDFGIAKAASRISVTNSGVVKGKLRYMSPEQVRQKPLDRRSDIFAAGVVLFEALTGRRLASGEDEGDIALALLLGSFPSPTSIVADLPPALDEVVAKALARDPEDRYQHASDLQEALERAVPPAPAREVGRLVEELGATQLGVRREALQKALEAPGDIFDAQNERGEPTEGASGTLATQAASMTTAHEAIASRRRRVRRVILGSAIGTLAVGAAFAAFALERTSAETRAPASSSALGAATSPGSAPTALEPASSATTPSIIVPSATAAAAASSTSSSPRRTTRALPPTDLHRKNPYGSP